MSHNNENLTSEQADECARNNVFKCADMVGNGYNEELQNSDPKYVPHGEIYSSDFPCWYCKHDCKHDTDCKLDNHSMFSGKIVQDCKQTNEDVK